MLFHPGDPARVGFERRVERADIRHAQTGALELRRHVVLPLAVRPIGIRDVARRLLEVRHEASPLQHLRQNVRDTFARDVRAAELRDRVVSVLTEYARIQSVRALGADGTRARRRIRVELTEELVQEQSTHRFVRTRIAREERALHRLRKIAKHEHRAIGVREVRIERARFFRCECFCDRRGECHGRVIVPRTL